MLSKKYCFYYFKMSLVILLCFVWSINFIIIDIDVIIDVK